MRGACEPAASLTADALSIGVLLSVTPYTRCERKVANTFVSDRFEDSSFRAAAHRLAPHNLEVWG